MLFVVRVAVVTPRAANRLTVEAADVKSQAGLRTYYLRETERMIWIPHVQPAWEWFTSEAEDHKLNL